MKFLFLSMCIGWILNLLLQAVIISVNFTIKNDDVNVKTIQSYIHISCVHHFSNLCVSYEFVYYLLTYNSYYHRIDIVSYLEKWFLFKLAYCKNKSSF